ncbi:hypothetical protein OG21DRAFT_1491968 [Imleria badia]|nr:hypothetical protein OG21DRAFT_1491968 [Imleria badia]
MPSKLQPGGPCTHLAIIIERSASPSDVTPHRPTAAFIILPSSTGRRQSASTYGAPVVWALRRADLWPEGWVLLLAAFWNTDCRFHPVVYRYPMMEEGSPLSPDAVFDYRRHEDVVPLGFPSGGTLGAGWSLEWWAAEAVRALLAGKTQRRSLSPSATSSDFTIATSPPTELGNAEQSNSESPTPCACGHDSLAYEWTLLMDAEPAR